MRLVVDVGNSRIKWARFDGTRLLPGGNAAHRGRQDEALDALATQLSDELDAVYISNVAGAALAERLRALVAETLGIEPVFARVTAEAAGVVCGYDDPARLGVDRWLALIAARRGSVSPQCVVSAGTAVTFDAMDAQGRHLGGLILPGARLMADALDRATGQIGATEPAEGAPSGLDLLGRSTTAAVAHGSMLALAAAIDRSVEMLRLELGSAPDVILTGGDAARLAPWLESRTRIEADLVLEGLVSLIEDGA